MEPVTCPTIEDLLPHAHPMILLNRFVEPLKNGCVCETTVCADGLLATDDGLPGYVGLELMAQTIAAYSGYSAWREGRPVRIGFLIGTPAWRTECDSFAIGQILMVKIEHVWGDDQLMRFKCQITGAESDDVLQAAELNVYQPNSTHQTNEQSP